MHLHSTSSVQPASQQLCAAAVALSRIGRRANNNAAQYHTKQKESRGISAL
jgi:hypothetical protein